MVCISLRFTKSVNCIRFPMKSYINSEIMLDSHVYCMKLFNFEIQRLMWSDLCAHKLYLLMLGHIFQARQIPENYIMCLLCIDGRFSEIWYNINYRIARSICMFIHLSSRITFHTLSTVIASPHRGTCTYSRCRAISTIETTSRTHSFIINEYVRMYNLIKD